MRNDRFLYVFILRIFFSNKGAEIIALVLGQKTKKNDIVVVIFSSCG